MMYTWRWNLRPIIWKKRKMRRLNRKKTSPQNSSWAKSFAKFSRLRLFPQTILSKIGGANAFVKGTHTFSVTTLVRFTKSVDMFHQQLLTVLRSFPICQSRSLQHDVSGIHKQQLSSSPAGQFGLSALLSPAWPSLATPCRKKRQNSSTRPKRRWQPVGMHEQQWLFFQ